MGDGEVRSAENYRLVIALVSAGPEDNTGTTGGSEGRGRGRCAPVNAVGASQGSLNMEEKGMDGRTQGRG